jgi:hypothetical protein
MKPLLQGLIGLGAATLAAVPASADAIRLFECSGKGDIKFVLAKSDGLPLADAWQKYRYFLVSRTDPPDFRRTEITLRAADEKNNIEIYENRADDADKETTDITLFKVERTKPKETDKPKPPEFMSLKIWTVQYGFEKGKPTIGSDCDVYKPKKP